MPQLREADAEYGGRVQPKFETLFGKGIPLLEAKQTSRGPVGSDVNDPMRSSARAFF
jgi:hypothetical protein